MKEMEKFSIAVLLTIGKSQKVTAAFGPTSYSSLEQEDLQGHPLLVANFDPCLDGDEFRGTVSYLLSLSESFDEDL